MRQFSDDGQWWWDGKTWIATAQVTLPQLPPTEIERSGKLALARADLAKGRPGFWWWTLLLSSSVNLRGFREYRTWTIEQLSLAVAYLLGPAEPMLVGEMSRYDVWDGWTRNLAIAVTGAHVIVFRIDHLDGQRSLDRNGRSCDGCEDETNQLFVWRGWSVAGGYRS